MARFNCFVLLIILSIVNLGHCSSVNNIIDLKWEFEDPLAFPPPHENDLKFDVQASCACRQILISSLQEAQHIQADSMGSYKYYSNFEGKPYYYNSSHGKYLFFLNGSGWLIGNTVGAKIGFIHNSSQYACPYLIPEGWMYVNNGYWYKDLSLVVRCIA